MNNDTNTTTTKIELFPAKSPTEVAEYIAAIIDKFDGGSTGWIASALVALSYGEGAAKALATLAHGELDDVDEGHELCADPACDNCEVPFGTKPSDLDPENDPHGSGLIARYEHP